MTAPSSGITLLSSKNLDLLRDFEQVSLEQWTQLSRDEQRPYQSALLASFVYADLPPETKDIVFKAVIRMLEFSPSFYVFVPRQIEDVVLKDPSGDVGISLLAKAAQAMALELESKSPSLEDLESPASSQTHFGLFYKTMAHVLMLEDRFKHRGACWALKWFLNDLQSSSLSSKPYWSTLWMGLAVYCSLEGRAGALPDAVRLGQQQRVDWKRALKPCLSLVTFTELKMLCQLLPEEVLTLGRNDKRHDWWYQNVPVYREMVDVEETREALTLAVQPPLSSGFKGKKL